MNSFIDAFNFFKKKNKSMLIFKYFTCKAWKQGVISLLHPGRNTLVYKDSIHYNFNSTSSSNRSRVLTSLPYLHSKYYDSWGINHLSYLSNFLLNHNQCETCIYSYLNSTTSNNKNKTELIENLQVYKTWHN